MRRTMVFMSLAVLGALLAAAVVFSALKKRESEVQLAMAHTAQVVVAAHPISLGAKLQPDDLKLARWSRDSLPEGYFSDPQGAVGAFARSQFSANEPIVNGRLLVGDKIGGVMPFLIPPGMRAMSIAVDEVADISGFVQPHTRVDVLLAISGNGPGESSYSRTVAQNLEVLAVAQEMERIKNEPEVVKEVTLLVTPAEAEKLTLATREGTIRLAMRSYGDAKIVATSGVAIDDLMRHTHADVPLMEKQPVAAPGPRPVAARRAHGPTPLHIEILRDGKSSEAFSFINSAVVGHSGGTDRDSAPPYAPPPPSAAPDDPSLSGAAAPHSATLSDPPIPALSSIPGSVRAGPPPAPALRPGEAGYLPLPKTLQIGAQ